MTISNKTSDRVIEISFVILSFISFIISPIYGTFGFSLPIVLLLWASYYGTKFTLKDSDLYQYVGSACFALFTALLIYQMHGMIEMHFFAFIGAILLIYYKKWQLQLPITILVVLHHSVLAYVQFLGYDEVYFTSADYMDVETFVIHVVLAAIIFFFCGLWAFIFKRNSDDLDQKNETMELQMKVIAKNILIANEIAKGQVDILIEADENDELGNALALMQKNLMIAKKREDEEKFFNVGLAQSSEILRNRNSKISELADEILSYLVKYLGANQGSLFVLNDKDSKNIFLECAATYAYNRKKFLEKKIEPGEGLIGAAYLEKDVIYLTNVPKDYISITSGLGEATPTCIVIVPLMINEEIYGVIELAFFKAIENFKVDFLKKVGENIASTIATAKINERTNNLLAVANQQREELRSQEEEMRQNMEELNATQEELSRKLKEQDELLMKSNLN